MNIQIKAMKLIDLMDGRSASVLAEFNVIAGPFLIEGCFLKRNVAGLVLAWLPRLRSGPTNMGFKVIDGEVWGQLTAEARKTYRLLGGTADGDGPSLGDPGHEPTFRRAAERPQRGARRHRRVAA